MNTEENKTETSEMLSTRDNISGFFIDDYSHLRLSYHQPHFKTSNVTSSDSAVSNSDSSFGFNSCDTIETNLSECVKDSDEKQKMREYYISQLPDLPHPSFTVASIIATASQKAGSQFRYNNRIEQGKKRERAVDLEFLPKRRSTLKCTELPK
ncbi:uncharacterized protein LOC113521000 [Galleria mellonella]|uniref:Uncharacterized protein LOC113521000 n=1 Tax=Galleria mellonella TaxID=7137 RepID=A0A6J1X060_GALME|nr:uncharacterized protein LOC113521000 [Galleria mellonella]